MQASGFRKTWWPLFLGMLRRRRLLGHFIDLKGETEADFNISFQAISHNMQSIEK